MPAPLTIADDHGSAWGRRVDGNGVDKAQLLGCAAALMSDCDFISAPTQQGVTTESAIMISPVVARVRITSVFGSVVRMTLTSPTGIVYGPDGAGPALAYGRDSASETYVIANPEPGPWKVGLYGIEVAPGGEQILLAVLVEQVSDDGEPCTVDTCDSASGDCTHSPLAGLAGATCQVRTIAQQLKAFTPGNGAVYRKLGRLTNLIEVNLTTAGSSAGAHRVKAEVRALNRATSRLKTLRSFMLKAQRRRGVSRVSLSSFLDRAAVATESVDSTRAGLAMH